MEQAPPTFNGSGMLPRPAPDSGPELDDPVMAALDDGELGLAQGVANLLNCCTDAAIGTVNLIPLVLNNALGCVPGVPTLQPIPAPDWSNGAVMYEDPLYHKISRVSGSAGIALASALLPLGNIPIPGPVRPGSLALPGGGSRALPYVLGVVGEVPACVSVGAGVANQMAMTGYPGGTANGPRAGKPFTPKGKREVIEDNAAQNNGAVSCEECGVETTPAQKSMKGVTPDSTEAQVDHWVPRSKLGDGSPTNGRVLCRKCNRQKSDKIQP
jgi:hypothetical protein